MPNKNKKKEQILFKNKKKTKSVKHNKIFKTSKINKVSLTQRNKTPINKNSITSNKINSFFSSIKIITTINNELDILNNDLSSKLKYNFNNNYGYKNYNYNMKSFNNNQFIENNNSFKKNKIKKMDNLYLYKEKNNFHKIYRQPGLTKTLSIRNRFKHNSFYNMQNQKRNILFPSLYMPSFCKNIKFDINSINNACKILLDKD